MDELSLSTEEEEEQSFLYVGCLQRMETDPEVIAGWSQMRQSKYWEERLTASNGQNEDTSEVIKEEEVLSSSVPEKGVKTSSVENEGGDAIKTSAVEMAESEVPGFSDDLLEESANKSTADVDSDSNDLPENPPRVDPYTSSSDEEVPVVTVNTRTPSQKSPRSRNHPYKCRFQNCPKSYVFQNDLQQHLQSCPFGNQFRCTQCPASFPSDLALRQHVIVHVTRSRQVWECELCGYQATSRQALRHHQINRHPGRR